MKELKSKYAVIRSNSITLISEEPKIKPAFDKLIKNATIIVDNNKIEVKGDLINYNICWNGMFVDNPKDYQEEDLVEKFNLFKFKKMPYLKRGWYIEKETTPFYLITNKYEISL